MIIKNNVWELEIDLNGGRIKRLKCGDKVILGTFERIDGKMANTHVCTPNFGDEGKEKGLIAHGVFRNLGWSKTPDDKSSVFRHSSESTSFDKEAVIIFCEDDGLRVEQIFELGEEFCHKIVVTNIGEEIKTVNIGSHNYWQIDNNWNEVKVDGVVVNKIIEDDDWYAAKNKQILEFDNKKIEWELGGYKKLRLWTGRKLNENGNKIFDQKYICIEPVFDKVGENLGVGESREVEQKIKLV